MNKKKVLIVISFAMAGVLVLSSLLLFVGIKPTQPTLQTQTKTPVHIGMRIPVKPPSILTLNQALAKIMPKAVPQKITVIATPIKIVSVQKKSINRGSICQYRNITLICTFYTNSPEETWGDGTVTASGKKVAQGMIAVNSLPFGTVILTNQYGTLTVEDRGNPNYFPYINSTTYRADVFIAKNAGETKTQYRNRIGNMGVQRISGELKL